MIDAAVAIQHDRFHIDQAAEESSGTTSASAQSSCHSPTGRDERVQGLFQIALAEDCNAVARRCRIRELMEARVSRIS